MAFSCFSIPRLNIRRCIATLVLFCQLTQIAAAAVAPNRTVLPPATSTQNTLFNNPQLLAPTELNNVTLSNQMLGLSGPLNLGINYSNLTGTYVNSQYVTTLGERAAFGALAEYGSGQYRLNGTLGYSLAPMSQIKASIERFGQRLPFHFDSGDIDARIHQDAYGARFQQLFDIPVLQGVNAGGYWAKADNKQLNPIIFTSNGLNCANFAAGLQCINYRHIAGATSKGLDVGLDLIPTPLTLVSGSVYYDEVHYNTVLTPFSTQNRSGLGAGVKINQLLNERFVVNGEAITRELYDSYQAGISWLPKTDKVGVELSLNGQHIVSRNATPDNSIISLQLNLLPQSDKLYQRYNKAPGHLNELAQWIATPAVRMSQVLAVAEQITQLLAPSIRSVTPNSGPIAGGNTITINGTNFSAGLLIYIGNQLASGINVLSTTQATLVVPAIADSGVEQLVDVVIQSPDGQRVSLTDGYTYTQSQVQPSISGIAPQQGSTSGGTLAIITGQNLASTTAVSFGGTLASISSVSNTQVEVLTNAHAAGAVAIELTTADGSVTVANAYTYVSPPATPTINPTLGSVLTGTGIANQPVILSVNNNVIGETTADANGNWQFNVTSALASGTVVTAVVVVNGIKSDPASVTVAAITPLVINPSNGALFNGTAEPNATVILYDGLVEIGQTAVNAGGTWSIALFTPLANGTLINGVATLAGIESIATITVDGTAPPAPIINPSNGLVITGTAEPGVTIILAVAGTGIGSTVVELDGTWSFTPATPLPSGTLITAVARDAAGNSSVAVSITIDAIAPDVPVMYPTNGALISGTAEAGSTVVLSISSAPIASVIVAADGSWSHIPTPPVPNGTQISAVARDAAGNSSPAATITVNAVLPNPPTINPTNGTLLTGSAAPGIKIIITAPGYADVDVDAQADGSWAYTPFISLANGTVVTAVARDSSGNESAPVSVIVDTSLPIMRS